MKPIFTVFAGLALAFAGAAIASSESTSHRPIEKGSDASLCVGDVARAEVLGCGETTCSSNADCPSNCGPCVTWSGTCALFQPRSF